MKMEQYLAYTDYALWEVILNSNGEVQMTKDEVGNEVEVPPVTAQQILARTREGKAKSTLLMAIPYEHLARFHGIKDAKTLWATIKTRFGGNAESKKMQKIMWLLSLQKAPAGLMNLMLLKVFLLLQAIVLRHKMAMLSMRVKRFYKKTRRKLGFNGKEPVGFDKTKVECFNCHRREHFARDCRTAMNPGNRGKDARNAGYKGRDNGKNPTREEDEKALFNEKEVLDVKEEEVTETVFDNRSSDEETSLANERFKKGKRFHVVLPPLTWNYMPPKPDLSFSGLDDSIYKFKISEIVTNLSKNVEDAPETSTAFIDKPKEVRTSAPLIQDWDTDSDNDSVITPKHIPTKINFVKAGEHVKPVKPIKTAEQTEKYNNFSSNRMAKKSVLPNNVGKGTGHRKSRPVWNNVQRINHQNKFAPIAVFIRFRRIPVSAAKPKAAASTSDAKPVNTAGPKQSVNFTNSRSTFHKSHSPIRRSFYNAIAHSRSNSTKRVNIAGSKVVSVVKENVVTIVKASTGCVWRPRVNEIDQISKDNRWICIRVDYSHPQQALKNKGIVDSG
nr:xylulose kinase-1 [Tanacetum cinerariifolium]